MKFKNFLLAVLVLISSFSLTVFGAGRQDGSIQGYRPQQPPASVDVSQATDDAPLVKAISNQRNVYYLEAANLKVTRLLPDDSSGLPHQKFLVTTSKGQKVLCVYNLDKGQRIPLKEGDDVGVGGEFKWTSQGALMHWLHADDRGRRPDGYVELAGRRYGDN